MQRKGVLLLNLGSPDTTRVSDVRNYLREFLTDGRVIDVPAVIRWIIVNLFILPTRPRQSAEAYSLIWTEEGSPLVVTSRKFADKLQEKVSIPVYLGMRYGNPSTESQIVKMKRDGIEEVLIFPLYPHYAMSSYESALVCATDSLKRIAPEINYRVVNPFFQDPAYIDCLIDQSADYLSQDYDHLLFSFHGIPERHLVKSDPSHQHCLSRDGCCEREHPAHATCYRHQCLQTVRRFVEKSGIPEGKYSVSFQSRLGRDPWLKPYTDFVLEELPARGVKRLLVMCPAFVTDCLETLEEISMRGKTSFIEAGGTSFAQIPCLNLNPKWIDQVAVKVNEFETFAEIEPLLTSKNR
jgi:protoporphyrin/coproporphyrin ferrochelatase